MVSARIRCGVFLTGSHGVITIEPRPYKPGSVTAVFRAGKGPCMEKRWEQPRLPVVPTIATSSTVAMGALVLGILALGAGVFASGFGSLIAKAVVAVVRSVFAALGGFLAR